MPPRAAVHIVLTKADGFAAAFGGIANNGVVCNRGQYIIVRKNDKMIVLSKQLTFFVAMINFSKR